MNLRRALHSLPVSLLILRSASVLVPAEARAEWLAEWKAELWQLCHARRHAPHDPFQSGPIHASPDATAFCLGAFQDALWLRRNQPRAVSVAVPVSVPHPVTRPVLCLGSATRCGFSLAVWAAASLLVCLSMPGTRKLLLPSPYRHAGDLVIVSRGGYAGIQSPAVRLSDYRAWKTNAHRLFTDLAFYQPAVNRVRIARHQTATLSIARASDNLFQLLNLPVSSTNALIAGPLHAATLILSSHAWRRYFRGDPDISGRVVEVGGQPVLIAGVLPDDSWRLPGRVDAWMLEDESRLSALPSNSRGFVLANAIASGFPAETGAWRTMTVVRDQAERDQGEVDRFECISVARRTRQPFSIFLFTLLLACLALPATTPLPLGDYPLRGDRHFRPARARRWIFLAIKFALLLPIVYFCSLDLAYSALPVDSPTSIYIQFAVSFFGLLLAFRWSLRDQRKRCPVCLRLLSNPARVGQASRSFLAWNGTELICTGGHGLLHIPEIPTSWFSTQRWLYLDPSWRILFPEASAELA